MNCYIIVFKNTLDAMMAEDKLEKNRIIFKVMPTPTGITQSCGLCISLEGKEDTERIIEEKIIEYKNIYIKEGKEYTLMA